jgi:hypothetical protein
MCGETPVNPTPGSLPFSDGALDRDSAESPAARTSGTKVRARTPPALPAKLDARRRSSVRGTSKLGARVLLVRQVYAYGHQGLGLEPAAFVLQVDEAAATKSVAPIKGASS